MPCDWSTLNNINYHLLNISKCASTLLKISFFSNPHNFLWSRYSHFTDWKDKVHKLPKAAQIVYNTAAVSVQVVFFQSLCPQNSRTPLGMPSVHVLALTPTVYTSVESRSILTEKYELFFDLRHVNVLNLEASDLLFLNAVTQAPASGVLEINSPLSPLPNSVPCKK